MAEIRLRRGVDFYIDDQGLMVFTAAFHLARGYCCGNRCRHCPYPYEVSADRHSAPKSPPDGPLGIGGGLCGPS